MTTIEENKSLVRDFIEALFSKGDLGAVDDLLAHDFVNHPPRLAPIAASSWVWHRPATRSRFLASTSFASKTEGSSNAGDASMISACSASSASFPSPDDLHVRLADGTRPPTPAAALSCIGDQSEMAATDRRDRIVVVRRARPHDVSKRNPRRLRAVMSIDAAFFATVDPVTLLFTSAVVEEPLRTAAPQFLENEFGRNDVNKFASLARSPDRVGSR